jgi:hypothetical protein
VSGRPTYHLTAAERDAMAAVYLEGRLTTRQIDRLFGVSEGICRDLVRIRGLPLRGRGWHPPLEARACRVEGCTRPGGWYRGGSGYCHVHGDRIRLHGEAGPPEIRGAVMPEHGTVARYARGCHCKPCMVGAAAHARVLHARRRQRGLPPGDPRHGRNGYSNWGCRCPICFLDHALRCHDAYLRRRGRAA